MYLKTFFSCNTLSVKVGFDMPFAMMINFPKLFILLLELLYNAL